MLGNGFGQGKSVRRLSTEAAEAALTMGVPPGGDTDEHDRHDDDRGGDDPPPHESSRSIFTNASSVSMVDDDDLIDAPSFSAALGQTAPVHSSSPSSGLSSRAASRRESAVEECPEDGGRSGYTDMRGAVDAAAASARLLFERRASTPAFGIGAGLDDSGVGRLNPPSRRQSERRASWASSEDEKSGGTSLNGSYLYFPHGPSPGFESRGRVVTGPDAAGGGGSSSVRASFDSIGYDSEVAQRELGLGCPGLKSVRVAKNENFSAFAEAYSHYEKEIMKQDAGNRGIVPIINHERRAKRGRQIFRAVLFVSAATVAVLGALVGTRAADAKVGKGGEGDGAASSASTANLPSWGERQSLPQPPHDLLDKCSPSAVADEVGWRECKDLCEVAECCYLSPEHSLSCATDENKTWCYQYENACETLDSDTKANKNNNQAKNSNVANEDEELTGMAAVEVVGMEMDAEEGKKDQEEETADVSQDQVHGIEVVAEVDGYQDQGTRT